MPCKPWIRGARFAGALCLLAGLVLSLGLGVGCGSDEDEDPSAVGVTGERPVFAVAQRVFLPSGRQFVVNVLPNLDAQTLDPSEALVFSGFSRLRAFNGKMFVFESESGEVIRFGVDDELRVVEEQRFSMQGLGVQNFSQAIGFISEHRAFYLDFGLGMVVFDPVDMAIVADFPVPETQRDGFQSPRLSTPLRIGDEVFVAITWENPTTLTYVPELTVLVFSATEDRLLRVVEDPRCGYSYRGFVHDGAYYTAGSDVDGLGAMQGGDPTPPPCLLRVAERATEMDGFVDLAAATGSPFVAGGPIGIGEGRFLLQIYDGPDDPQSALSFEEFARGELWRWSVLELSATPGEAPTTTRLEEIPLSGTNPFDPAGIDGFGYVPVLAGDGGQSEVFRVDPSDMSVTPSMRSESGEIIQVLRVR